MLNTEVYRSRKQRYYLQNIAEPNQHIEFLEDRIATLSRSIEEALAIYCKIKGIELI